MEKPRVRPLWLIVFLLIPLLLLLPLVFRGNRQGVLPVFRVDTQVLLVWSGYAVISSLWFVLNGAIIAFSIWLKNRVALRSCSWLVAYLAFQMAFSLCQQIIWPLVVQKIFRGNSGIYGWTPANTFLLHYFSSSAAALLLGALIASDVLFTLQKNGIEADNSALRVLARARDWSTPLGVLMLIAQMMPLFFLVYTYFR